jgi:hypothetical protein
MRIRMLPDQNYDFRDRIYIPDYQYTNTLNINICFATGTR